MKKYLIFSLFLGLGLTLSACGSTERDICEAARDCVGGTDSEVDDCVAEAEDSREEAADYGCGDAYDNMMECTVDNATCDPELGYGVYDSSCDSTGAAYTQCFFDNYQQ